MYLRKLELKDFRGFASLQWEVAEGEEAGWHVLMGPNGAGKTSVLRAIAIGIIGPNEFSTLRRPFTDFIRSGENVNATSIDFRLYQDNHWDFWSGRGATAPAKLIRGRVFLFSHSEERTTGHAGLGKYISRTVWGSGKGWFSAAFGPMRRFTGGSPESLRLFHAFPRLARHLSVFGEDIALTEALEWLKELRYKQIENSINGIKDIRLDQIREFTNQDGFLPYGAKLAHISSEGVSFIDGNGVTLPILELSDGYRAVLSLTFELIRQMADCYGAERLFSADKRQIVAPGVVLIDEVDAHLHPSWQRQIGPWLTKLFPQVQFIVTTHSPYVCQSAVHGSVWVLPAPGEEGALRRLEGEALQRVLYGDVLHVLNSEAFGGQPGRSDVALAKLERLTKLNRKHERGALSDVERQERADLLALLAPVLDAGHA